MPGGVDGGQHFKVGRLASLSVGDKETEEVSLAEVLKQVFALGGLVNRNHRDRTDHSDWVVEQERKLNNVSKKLTDLCKDVATIRQDNLNLKKQVTNLTVKVNEMKQYMKEKMFEKNLLPYDREENII